MTNYQTRLLLESISTVFSAEELLDGKDLRKVLRAAFGIADAGASCLLDGALTLKKLRNNRQDTENPIYVH